MAVRLDVKNFGPIRTGTFLLKPLTVFIGPNNSGKSVLAMLTYAAFHSAPRKSSLVGRTGALGLPGPLRFRRRLSSLTDLPEWLEALAERAAAHRSDVLPMPDDIADIFAEELESALENYALRFSSELERCFGSSLQELSRVQNGRRHNFVVTITHGSPHWQIDIDLRWGRLGIDIKSSPEPREVLEVVWRRREYARLLDRERIEKAQPDRLIYELSRAMIQICFREFTNAAYYLPAARSGILQNHKALASFVVENAPLVGIQDMQIPKMTGVISDFLSQVLRAEPDRREHFADVASYLENQLLEGSVDIEPGPTYPEISYEANESTFSLHRTSSMISELAPVVLYLKYVINSGDLLIIEEPESHLHPRSQVRLARAVAKLVNQGLYIILTTHSDYFISRINNAIATASLPQSVLAEQQLSTGEAINAERVQAYIFDRSSRGGGTVVRPISVTRREGIDDAEFAQVAEALYNQTARLERRFEDGE